MDRFEKENTVESAKTFAQNLASESHLFLVPRPHRLRGTVCPGDGNGTLLEVRLEALTDIV